MAAAGALSRRTKPWTKPWTSAVLGLALSSLSACGGKSAGEGAEAAPSTAADASSAPSHAPEVARAIEQGHELFFGRALCSTCHSVGGEGTMMVGPNLGVGEGMTEPFAVRVFERADQIDPPLYVIESILDPNAVVVEGYARSVMKSPKDIPIELSDDDYVALAAFVLSIGASEAIEAGALERARAHISVATASREARRAAKEK